MMIMILMVLVVKQMIMYIFVYFILQIMQELLAQSGVLERLMSVLYKAASPGDSTRMQAGYWGKSVGTADVPLS